MEIRNKNFIVGQRYRGQINGAILEVVKVEEGRPPYYKQASVFVTFQDEQGKRHTLDIRTAQRALIDLIA